jgi:hypothetical protein
LNRLYRKSIIEYGTGSRIFYSGKDGEKEPNVKIRDYQVWECYLSKGFWDRPEKLSRITG